MVFDHVTYAAISFVCGRHNLTLIPLHHHCDHASSRERAEAAAEAVKMAMTTTEVAVAAAAAAMAVIPDAEERKRQDLFANMCIPNGIRTKGAASTEKPSAEPVYLLRPPSR